VGGAIVFFNEKTMHYHLAGTKLEYRKFAVSNLILYEAALWANKMGIKKFHLGGGMSPNDSLFGFKKQFNKTDSLKFVVGRTIFDKQSYTLLLNIRIENDKMFNPNNHFMIQYRG
jgi:lipid II:glycine glycyltransferase (peptidoglycan interpeptide bridge formation enzyme)